MFLSNEEKDFVDKHFIVDPTCIQFNDFLISNDILDTAYNRYMTMTIFEKLRINDYRIHNWISGTFFIRIMKKHD